MVRYAGGGQVLFLLISISVNGKFGLSNACSILCHFGDLKLLILNLQAIFSNHIALLGRQITLLHFMQ